MDATEFESSDNVCVIVNGKVIVASMGDTHIEMPLEKYGIFCRLVNAAQQSNIYSAFIDNADNMHILLKKNLPTQ